MTETTFDVRIWKIEVREGKTKTTYYVRWRAASRRFKEPFATRPLANSFRSKLQAAAADGVAFDVKSGLPVTMLRKQRPDPYWLPFAQDYVDMKWPHLAPKSRKSMIDSLVAISAAMLDDDRTPESKLLYKSFRRSLNPTTRDKGHQQDTNEALQWVAAHCRKASALSDPETLRSVLSALERKQDGTQAAQDTIRLRRTTLRDAISYLIEKEVLSDVPLEEVKVKRPSVKLRQVDRRSVANPVQIRTLLLAVKEDAPRLTAFFASMYFAALRPEEATNLRKHNLSLPERGWGEIHLESATPEVGAEYSDNQAASEERSLKHRGDFETRTVPCPPELTEHLQTHLNRFGTTPDGRLFRGRRSGGPLSSTVYGRAWERARKAVFVPSVVATPLAKRPYDLRHAAVSAWLNAGVEPTRVADWAGHSVSVLLRVYAKCLDGGEQAARDRVQAMLGGG